MIGKSVDQLILINAKSFHYLWDLSLNFSFTCSKVISIFSVDALKILKHFNFLLFLFFNVEREECQTTQIGTQLKVGFLLFFLLFVCDKLHDINFGTCSLEHFSLEFCKFFPFFFYFGLSELWWRIDLCKSSKPLELRIVFRSLCSDAFFRE